jgi:hypothetical protein
MGRFCDSLVSNIVYLMVLYWSSRPNYCKGSAWTGWVINASHDPDVISVQQCTLPTTMLELFSYGLKSVKVNFSISPDQHNHHI